MKTILLLFFTIFALSTCFAAPTVEELAARYDYVARVTHTSDGRFNRVGKTWGNLNDTATQVTRTILVGITKDRDDYFPYWGDLYFEKFIGTGEIFIRFSKVNGNVLEGIDDGDNSWRIVIIRKGSGYKRRDR